MKETDRYYRGKRGKKGQRLSPFSYISLTPEDPLWKHLKEFSGELIYIHLYYRGFIPREKWEYLISKGLGGKLVFVKKDPGKRAPFKKASSPS